MCVNPIFAMSGYKGGFPGLIGVQFHSSAGELLDGAGERRVKEICSGRGTQVSPPLPEPCGAEVFFAQ